MLHYTSQFNVAGQPVVGVPGSVGGPAGELPAPLPCSAGGAAFIPPSGRVGPRHWSSRPSGPGCHRRPRASPTGVRRWSWIRPLTRKEVALRCSTHPWDRRTRRAARAGASPARRQRGASFPKEAHPRPSSGTGRPGESKGEGDLGSATARRSSGARSSTPGRDHSCLVDARGTLGSGPIRGKSLPETKGLGRDQRCREGWRPGECPGPADAGERGDRGRSPRGREPRAAREGVTKGSSRVWPEPASPTSSLRITSVGYWRLRCRATG